MDNNGFDVIEELKEMARSLKPKLVKRVRGELRASSEDYLRLFDCVFERYYNEIVLGRWYDPCHIAYSTLFAVGLVRRGEASRLVLPAIILHDIGYYSALVDKENWVSRDSRVIHMQEGAGLAAEILVENGEFDGSEVGQIVGMVASHDNGYLAIPTRDADRLALRDADRIWVMHPLSFYKDWFSKRKKGEDLSLLDLFQSRLSSFYGHDEIYPAEWGRIDKPDKEDAMQSPPFTGLAKEWRDKQFGSRFREIQENITIDLETFRREAKKWKRI